MSTSAGAITLDLTLNSKIEEQLKKLTKGIADKFSGSVEEINGRLEKSIQKPFESMQKASEKANKSIAKPFENIKKTVNETAKYTQESWEEAYSATRKSFDRCISRMAESDKRFAESEKETINSVGETSKKIANSTLDYWSETIEREQELLNQLSNTKSEVDPTEKLKTVAVKKSATAMPVPSSLDDLDKYAEVIRSGCTTIEEIEEKLKNMSSTADKSVQKINNNIKSSIEQFTKVYDVADKPLERLNQKLEIQYSKLVSDQKAVAELGKQYAELDKSEIQFGEGSKSAQKLEQALYKAESQVLRDKDAIDKLNEQIEKTIQKAKETAEKAVTKAGQTVNASASQASNAVKKTSVSADNAIKSNLENPVKRANSRFSKIKAAILGVGSAGKSAFSKLRSHLKSTDKSARNTNGLLSKLGKTVKGVFKATFITAALYGAFRGLKSLFSDAMSQSKEFQKSLNNLKANFKIAFQPVISTVLPILTKLMNALSQVMAKVASFISGVFGTTYDKSKQAAKQASQTAKKSSEEAEEYLNSYDVMNKAQDTSKDKSDSEDDGVDFDAVDTKGSKAAEKLGAKFKKIMSELFAPIKDAWSKHGQPVMDSIKTTAGKIKKLFVDIGKDFKDVWTDGTGERYVRSILNLVRSIVTTVGKIAGAFDKAWNKCGAGKKLIQSIFDSATKVNNLFSDISDSIGKAFDSPAGVQFFSNILSIVTNISNFIGNIAEGLDEAWEKAGLGDSIMLNLLNLFNSITGFVERITGSLAKWAGGLDFTPILTSINTLLEGVTSLSDAIGGVLGDAFETVLLPLASWVFEKGAPAAIETFSSLLDGLGTIINTIRPGLEHFYDKVLKPIGSWAGSVIIEALGKLKELFSKVAGVFKDKGSEIQNVISGVSDYLSLVWEKYLKPILNTIKKYIFDQFDNFIDTVGGVLSGIIDALSGLVDFVKAVFKGDWKAAWESVKKIVTGVWNGIWSAIKGVINYIINGINLLWSGIYRAIKGIVKVIGGVASVVGNLLGQDWSFSIPDNPKPIPPLAKGGLATAPTLAMVGDNRNAKTDPEVIAPLSKLKGMLDNGSDSEIVSLLKEILAFLRNINPEFVGMVDGDVLYKCIVKKNKSNTNRTGVNALA